MSPAAVERRFLQNGDVSIATYTSGSGMVPVVFAHGWISSHRMWTETIAALDPDRAKAISFDFRGCGESDRPLAGHTLDGYASDLHTVLQSVGEPSIIVGHSMGGRVAQYVATQAPSQVRGMVLVASGVATGSVLIPRHRELTEHAYGSRRRLSGFQRGAMVAEVAPEVTERLLNDALIAQREHWFGWYDGGRREDFSARLGSLTVPTLVVAGFEDVIAPLPRIHREVTERIAGARELVVPDCGHNIPIEAPTVLADAIESLLADIRAREAGLPR